MRSHRSNLFLSMEQYLLSKFEYGSIVDHNQIKYSRAGGKDELQLTEMVSIKGDPSKASALFAGTPRSCPSRIAFFLPIVVVRSGSTAVSLRCSSLGLNRVAQLDFPTN